MLLALVLAGTLGADWLKGMRPPKDAYKYAGTLEGAIKARFPCRLRREWMGRELPWPPKVTFGSWLRRIERVRPYGSC